MRYKGMLWIDGEPNRLLFQGVQRLYSADWDRPWGDEAPHSTLVFIGINLPEEEIARRLPDCASNGSTSPSPGGRRST
jgi:G3E family GTPase